jgi:hypothetical protein
MYNTAMQYQDSKMFPSLWTGFSWGYEVIGEASKFECMLLTEETDQNTVQLLEILVISQPLNTRCWVRFLMCLTTGDSQAIFQLFYKSCLARPKRFDNCFWSEVWIQKITEKTISSHWAWKRLVEYVHLNHLARAPSVVSASHIL